MSLAKVKFAPFYYKNSIIRNLMRKIFLYVWGLGFRFWGLRLGFGGVVGGLVGFTYTHLLKIYSLNSL